MSPPHEGHLLGLHLREQIGEGAPRGFQLSMEPQATRALQQALDSA